MLAMIKMKYRFGIFLKVLVTHYQSTFPHKTGFSNLYSLYTDHITEDGETQNDISDEELDAPISNSEVYLAIKRLKMINFRAKMEFQLSSLKLHLKYLYHTWFYCLIKCMIIAFFQNNGFVH